MTLNLWSLATLVFEPKLKEAFDALQEAKAGRAAFFLDQIAESYPQHVEALRALVFATPREALDAIAALLPAVRQVPNAEAVVGQVQAELKRKRFER